MRMRAKCAKNGSCFKMPHLSLSESHLSANVSPRTENLMPNAFFSAQEWRARKVRAADGSGMEAPRMGFTPLLPWFAHRRTHEGSGTSDKLHLFPSPTKPASVAFICFLQMIIADSSAQKPGYTQGWLKRHSRGQKVGQSCLRSQGRVNHVRVLHFFQSAGYHRSPLARCTSQYPQAELKESSLSYTREDLAPPVSWSLPVHSYRQRKILPRLKLSQNDHRGRESIKIINNYWYNNPFYDTIKLHDAFQDVDKLHSLH